MINSLTLFSFYKSSDDFNQMSSVRPCTLRTVGLAAPPDTLGLSPTGGPITPACLAWWTYKKYEWKHWRTKNVTLQSVLRFAASVPHNYVCLTEEQHMNSVQDGHCKSGTEKCWRGYKWGLIRQVAFYSIHPLESQRKGLRNDRDQP